jgi:DNA-binding transcriptional MerR regulator
MNAFSIRDIENLTGIKAHTLRVWEKRYSMIMPPTSPGKHRFYDNNDLKHILRISMLYHSGVKISKIANMSVDEMKRSSTLSDTKGNFEVFITRLIEFDLDFKEAAFRKLLSELRETMGEINMYLHVVFPYLNRIGTLWMNGKVSPVQEHFSSNIIRSELIQAIDSTTHVFTRKQPLCILFTPVNENHEIPLLFVNYLLRKNRVNTLYIGTNVEIETIKEVAQKTNATLIVTYLITNFTTKEVDQYVYGLTETFKDKKIVCAGPGFKTIQPIKGILKSPKSMEELIELCESLRDVTKQLF